MKAVRDVRRLINVHTLLLLLILGVALAAGYFLKPKPDGLYSSGEEETSWRQGRLDPSRMASDLRHKFRDIERRIREAEAYVTSSEFKLKRDFDDL